MCHVLETLLLMAVMILALLKCCLVTCMVVLSPSVCNA